MLNAKRGGNLTPHVASRETEKTDGAKRGAIWEDDPSESAKDSRPGRALAFRRDDDPKRKAGATTTRFQMKRICASERPGQSPDLDLIEICAEIRKLPFANALRLT